MGKETGFLEYEREERTYADPQERLTHYKEFTIPHSEGALKKQAARCMNCGIPYCHNGCPVNNIIPDWNHLVYEDDWKNALAVLHSTNNFPEFTGRICPAPCEAACTLNIVDEPVTIKSIECAIVDRGWKEGWVEPQVPEKHTGKSVAVVGSGPAGLACAQQLARAGHAVTVFEKSDRIGGLLRYGIPDFKMEKHLINRRAVQMEAEGVQFRTSAEVGVEVSFQALRDNSPIPYDVIVIGGGDTGSDCVGTSNRQGAASVTQLEIMPKPPEKEDKAMTWPHWPLKLRTSSSHEEGAERDWAVLTKRVVGENGDVTGLECVRIEWDGRSFEEVPGSEFTLKADLILLAMGFTGPKRRGLLDRAGVELCERGNVKADTDRYATSEDGVYACGDMRRGQSLVVWAIREGRQCARAVDEALMGVTELPR